MRQTKTHIAMTLESDYRSVKPSSKPEDFEKISAIARDAKSEKTRLDLRDA